MKIISQIITAIAFNILGAAIITFGARHPTFWIGKQLGEIPQNLIAKENLK